MKRMVSTFAYILTALVCVIGGAAIASLHLEAKHEDKIYTMQAAIDTEKHESLKLEKKVADLTEEKSELYGEISRLEASQAELENNNKKLSEVISRFRENPNWWKERIPPGNTDWYALEPYTAIDNERSSQYALQQMCSTGLSTGIRIYEDSEGELYYCAALGSAYGRDIGDAWEVTLDNGESFRIIYADYKDDGKTEFFGHPCRNARKKPCTNVIEFIVDWEKLPSEVRERGSMSKLDWCDGNIIEMKHLGRVWE